MSQVLRRDAFAAVADSYAGVLVSGTDLDVYFAFSCVSACARVCTCIIHGLDCVEEEVEKDLVNLIAIVLDFGQIGRLLGFDLDGLGEHLLAREHHGVFDGGVEVAAADLRRMGARGFEKIGEDAVDLNDLEANIFDYGAGGAG